MGKDRFQIEALTLVQNITEKRLVIYKSRNYSIHANIVNLELRYWYGYFIYKSRDYSIHVTIIYLLCNDIIFDFGKPT